MKSKTAQILYRQGDVLIEAISSLPKDSIKLPREKGRVILAHGEATGHAHTIADKHCDLFSSDTEAGVTFLDVQEAVAALTHDEHSTIELPPGKYRVRRQREYSPEEIRNVQD